MRSVSRLTLDMMMAMKRRAVFKSVALAAAPPADCKVKKSCLTVFPFCGIMAAL